MAQFQRVEPAFLVERNENPELQIFFIWQKYCPTKIELSDGIQIKKFNEGRKS